VFKKEFSRFHSLFDSCFEGGFFFPLTWGFFVRTLILDFTMTHTRYDRSHVNPTRQLTNIMCSDGVPEPDGALKVVVRKKIIHYPMITNYTSTTQNRSSLYRLQLTRQAAFMMTFFVFYFWILTVNWASAVVNDIPEESVHFRFLRAACLANIKGSVGLILAKASVMRISMQLDLSSRPFIPECTYSTASISL